MKHFIIRLLAVAVLASAIAGCACEPIEIDTRTENTETVIDEDIVDPGNPPPCVETPSAPEETINIEKSRSERVIERGTVVK